MPGTHGIRDAWPALCPDLNLPQTPAHTFAHSVFGTPLDESERDG